MGSWRASLAVVMVVAVGAGCATLRRQGDQALERRSYVEAAELYDEALLDDPKDDRALAGRARARDAALTELLEEAQQARAQGRAAEARNKLARVFRLRHHWFMVTPPALVPALEREAAAAALEVAQAIRPLLLADAPLAAEAAFHEEHGVVDEPELAAARRKLRADITVAGKRRCEHYLADTVAEGSAYWGWLVARYCRHFGRAAAAPPLPDLVGGVEVAGTIEGMSPAASTAVAERLGAVLVGTPWHASGASARVAGELRGTYTSSYQRAPVTREAPWTEHVAYTATESRMVPHQVSQMQTETYFVTVPYTTMESESYSCGDSHSFRTCSRSRSVPHTRSESRTRSVLRWHTEYRTVVENVTRYRNVPRVFRYTAERRQATFALASTLSVSFPDSPPVTLSLERHESVEAMRHDVTFSPAGIEPDAGRLPSADEWLRASLDPVLERAKRELRAAWQTRFCQRDDFTVEEAARCLYGGKPFAAATAGLGPVAGAETDALAAFAVAP